MLPTINFHLIKACNFNCKFCYATFEDISSRGLTRKQQFELIKMLSDSKLFRKINFAGGEPTLVTYIRELIEYTKSLGFETSIVTNASIIDVEWVKSISPYLDILTISVDSIHEETNIISGRNHKQKTVSTEKLIKIAETCHMYGIHLKINTVVSKFNHNETLTDFINKIKPFRWKILQVTRVEGQNDTQFDEVKITSQMFKDFCNRNKQNLSHNIKVVEESDDIIQGSYLMIDPLARFYDSTNQKHNYSDDILKIGVKNALKQIRVDIEKFKERDGDYSTTNEKSH